jgi:hypothetical protein
VLGPLPTTVTCFISDSNFNPLTDCQGNPINYPASGGDNGDFLVMLNAKGVEVSTNPGQFYYNLLYTNTTGSTQYLTVTLAPNSSVTAQGTNSVHWWVFDNPLAPPTLANFNTVNAGNKNGKSLTIGTVANPIVVNDGQTLYVDMHLAWSGTGQKPPASPPLVSFTTGCSLAPTGTGFLVTGTVNFSDGTYGTCNASADGYGK